jgi:hypothetical protein
MKKFVNLVEPASHALIVPEPVRAAYPNIEAWRWVCINDLKHCCLDLHCLFVEVNGRPKEGIQVSWVTDGPRAIFENFGPIMHDNDIPKLLAGRPVRYRYATRHVHIKPSVGDFRIDVEAPPSEKRCREENIFVPKGWADEVIGLISEGYFKVSLHPNGLTKYRIDGTAKPYKKK